MEEMMLLSRNQMLSVLRIEKLLSVSSSCKLLIDELINIVRKDGCNMARMEEIIGEGFKKYYLNIGQDGYKWKAHKRVWEILIDLKDESYQEEIFFNFIRIDDRFFFQDLQEALWIASLKEDMKLEIEEPENSLLQLKKVLIKRLRKESGTKRERTKRNHWYNALYDMVSCICTDELNVPESGTERRS